VADRLSDNERLGLLEELLAALLTGTRLEHQTFGRELELQRILTSMREKWSGGPIFVRLPESAGSFRTPQTPSLPQEFSLVSSHVLELEQRLTDLDRKLSSTRENQGEILLAMSLSPALASVPFRRIVPAFVYLNVFDSETPLALEHSLKELAASVGFELFSSEPVEYSSWFRNMLTRAKDVMTHEEVQSRLGKVERAIELRHLDSVQATTDLALSKAAKNIATILANVPEGAVCLGSLCGIKTANGSLVILNMTQEQMLEVAKNPSLKKSPEKLLQLLERHRDGPAPQPVRRIRAIRVRKTPKPKPHPPTSGTLDS